MTQESKGPKASAEKIAERSLRFTILGFLVGLAALVVAVAVPMCTAPKEVELVASGTSSSLVYPAKVIQHGELGRLPKAYWHIVIKNVGKLKASELRLSRQDTKGLPPVYELKVNGKSREATSEDIALGDLFAKQSVVVEIWTLEEVSDSATFWAVHAADSVPVSFAPAPENKGSSGVPMAIIVTAMVVFLGSSLKAQKDLAKVSSASAEAIREILADAHPRFAITVDDIADDLAKAGEPQATVTTSMLDLVETMSINRAYISSALVLLQEQGVIADLDKSADGSVAYLKTGKPFVRQEPPRMPSFSDDEDETL